MRSLVSLDEIRCCGAAGPRAVGAPSRRAVVAAFERRARASRQQSESPRPSPLGDGSRARRARSELRRQASRAGAPTALGPAAPATSNSQRAHKPRPGSAREEELLGSRVARAAQRPVIAERRRHIAELRVGDDHALNHRRAPDRCRSPRCCPPRCGTAPGRAWPAARRSRVLACVHDLHDPLHRGRRFDTFLALGLGPPAATVGPA